MDKHVHVMTEPVLRIIKSRQCLETLTCRKCGLPIEPGDNYVSRSVPQRVSAYRRSPRYYHQACWDGLFLETEE
jgi:hypothetical protein